MLTLVNSDEPILRTQCAPVDKFPIDSNLIQEMFDLMNSSAGCGLAAPQCGLNSQIFVIERSGNKKVFVNPKIVEFGTRKEIMEEMCLSLPGKKGNVSRSRKIKVEYQDENGKSLKATFEGLMSRIFQHELDHLNGILFTDRI